MQPTLRLLTPSLFLALSAQADWLLNSYATAASDSAQTRAVYGIQTFQNQSSSVTTSVPGGYVQLTASQVASDGTEGYSAEVGLRHPLASGGDAYDLTGLTAVTFEYQNSTNITDVFSVSFGSDAYPASNLQARTIYTNDIAGVSMLRAGTTWKQAEVLVADFATPSWWTDIPDNYPIIEDVLKRVRSVDFVPKTLYSGSGTQNGMACTKCVNPTMTSLTLKIRNVRLVGVDSLRLASAVPPAVFRQIRSFADVSVPVGSAGQGYRLSDFFQGATGYSARRLTPISGVVVSTTADSLYLVFDSLAAGAQDLVEVRADSGAKSLRDTFVVACASQATWLLSAYSTVASDSAQARVDYGIRTFQNPSSSVTVSVPGGHVQLVASAIASEGTQGWSVDIGLTHPLAPDGVEYDLTGLQAITFEYQNSTPITDVLSVSFDSPAYSASQSHDALVYSNDIAGRAALAAGTTWKQAELNVLDFAPPAWWTDIPDDYPTIDSVLKKVSALVFRPRTLYSQPGSQNGTACTKCVGPTMTSQVLKIRNIRLVGIDSLRSGSPAPYQFSPMSIGGLSKGGWRRTGDRLTVVVPEGVQRATLEVRGLDGKLVRTESAAPHAGEATWSLGNLHGTYFLQVRSESKPLQNRLLVLP